MMETHKTGIIRDGELWGLDTGLFGTRYGKETNVSPKLN